MERFQYGEQDENGDWVRFSDIPLESLRRCLDIAADHDDIHHWGYGQQSPELLAAVAAMREWLGPSS